MVVRNRDYGETPEITFSLENAVRQSAVRLSSVFAAALTAGDTSTALRVWSAWAEEHLSLLWRRANSEASCKRGRGAVRLDPEKVWPEVRSDCVANLQLRQLWRFLCRAAEVEKRPHGYSAQKVWDKLRHSSKFFYTENCKVVQSILSQPRSAIRAEQLKRLCEHEFRDLHRNRKIARIQAWKSQLQGSLRAQHKWLQQDTGVQVASCLVGTHGRRTACVAEQFEAVRLAWSAVTDLFKFAEPDRTEFWQKYAEHVRPVDYDMPTLTGGMLRDEVSSSAHSSPGLDGWKIGDFKLLAQACPRRTCFNLATC